MMRTFPLKVFKLVGGLNTTCFKNFSSIHSLKNNKTDVIESDENLGHTPVMWEEVVKAFDPKDDQIFLDMTFGGGGHSRHLLNAASIKLYCMDRDTVAYEKAKLLANESSSSHKVTPLLGRFSEMKELLKAANIGRNSIDGILIDAGCSSLQMDSAKRGFSISRNAPLDMRMDGERFPDQPTAADVLNSLDVPSLAKIFKVYGEERHSKKIAQALIDARYMLRTIDTTHELANLVQTTLGNEQRLDKMERSAHVATKVFQALRIFVNDELNELNYGIEAAYDFLKPGGKLIVLTFHSLEDRIAKRQLLGIDLNEPVSHSMSQKYKNASLWHTQQNMSEICVKKWTPMYKHVVKPSEDEIDFNPRSRSAKLRAAIKSEIVQ